jgi:hypothetical protein
MCQIELTFDLTSLDQIQHINLKNKLVRNSAYDSETIVNKYSKRYVSLPNEPF